MPGAGQLLSCGTPKFTGMDLEAKGAASGTPGPGRAGLCSQARCTRVSMSVSMSVASLSLGLLREHL